MTRQELIKGSGTEFSRWLRSNKEIDSSFGYTATNIDYIWNNYKTKKFMLIEEKRYRSEMSYSQKSLIDRVHVLCTASSDYQGFHFIQFEKTNPEDGKIFLDKEEVSIEQLLNFLKFKPVEVS
jgi:hypothetical protein